MLERRDQVSVSKKPLKSEEQAEFAPRMQEFVCGFTLKDLLARILTMQEAVFVQHQELAKTSRQYWIDWEIRRTMVS